MPGASVPNATATAAMHMNQFFQTACLTNIDQLRLSPKKVPKRYKQSLSN